MKLLRIFKLIFLTPTSIWANIGDSIAIAIAIVLLISVNENNALVFNLGFSIYGAGLTAFALKIAINAIIKDINNDIALSVEIYRPKINQVLYSYVAIQIFIALLLLTHSSITPVYIGFPIGLSVGTIVTTISNYKSLRAFPWCI
ncbi:hypothetical protein IPF86_03535 [Candidatus Nomurabacteria bacterium]|jgi:hypothetical protein|nr:MAG: hypothetical protein IPF86_03535 [Candidatus Nomurabacteria bacterium]